jgi:DNA-binding NarL/FixJ family response regulator
MKKSVMIVEDDRDLREQLTRILEAESDIKCLGAFASGEEALPNILSRKPDVVLMDIKLPRMSGIECVLEIKRALPEMQIVMVTVYEDSERIFQALTAGASGYLVKSSPPRQLIQAVRDAYVGGAPMSIHIARKVVQHFHTLGVSARESENLSPREREVLDLLALGFIYKEIGARLNISAETVRSHVKNICEKMHVRSRLQAVAKHRLEPH